MSAIDLVSREENVDIPDATKWVALVQEDIENDGPTRIDPSHFTLTDSRPQQKTEEGSTLQTGCLLLILVVAGFWYFGAKFTSNQSSPTVSEPSPSPSPSPSPTQVMPPETGPLLELKSWHWSIDYDYAKAEGQITNISNQSLKSVAASVSFYDKQDRFITSEESLIDYNPILAGQTSPFSVMVRHNPAMHHATIEFKYLFGGVIATRKKK